MNFNIEKTKEKEKQKNHWKFVDSLTERKQIDAVEIDVFIRKWLKSIFKWHYRLNRDYKILKDKWKTEWCLEGCTRIYKAIPA